MDYRNVAISCGLLVCGLLAGADLEPAKAGVSSVEWAWHLDTPPTVLDFKPLGDLPTVQGLTLVRTPTGRWWERTLRLRHKGFKIGQDIRVAERRPPERLEAVSVAVQELLVLFAYQKTNYRLPDSTARF